MQNQSGIHPVEYNVVIKPDPVEQKTKGGLILSDETLERNKHASTKGTLVALAPLAFDDAIWPSDTQKPQPGARVLISRYAGTFCEGLDGEEYRVVKDKDVMAIMDE